jgi:hypothetical protein
MMNWSVWIADRVRQALDALPQRGGDYAAFGNAALAFA